MILLLLQSTSQVLSGEFVLRIEFERAAIVANCVFQIVRLLECQAQVVVGVEKVGPQ